MNGSGSGSRNGGPSGGGGGGLKPPSSERKGESKEVARVHYAALREFLATWLKEGEFFLLYESWWGSAMPKAD